MEDKSYSYPPPKKYQILLQTLYNHIEHLQQTNKQLKQQRNRDLLLLRNKQLKICELKAQVQNQKIIIFQMKKRQQLHLKKKCVNVLAENNNKEMNANKFKFKFKKIDVERRKSQSCGSGRRTGAMRDSCIGNFKVKLVNKENY